MAIPNTRQELTDQLEHSFGKFTSELDLLGPRGGKVVCVSTGDGREKTKDDWAVKDLIAVRVWWTEAVVGWIIDGQEGKQPELPAPGYRWRDTPQLNADVVKARRRTSFAAQRRRLDSGYAAVITLTRTLSDIELLRVGHFDWTGKYPVSRWLSINAVRQYTTAATFIRRARKAL